jgi:hypothetical protein
MLDDARRTNQVPVQLPKPDFRRCKTFAEALHFRRTHREISGQHVGMELLSEILFAGRGKNRALGRSG